MKKIKVKDLIESFKKDYAELFEAGAEIKGVYGTPANIENDRELKVALSYGIDKEELINPFYYHISLWVNFLTNHRKIPKFYKGIRILTVVKSSTEPEEFDFDDGTREFIPFDEIKFPERYEEYVNNHADEIRAKFGDKNLTKKEMLDALCWGDFKKYKRKYYKE